MSDERTNESVRRLANEAWADRLTDDRLASDLCRLADDVRFYSPDERAAILREAAKRLLAR
jgi:hypothetical protein